LPPHADNKPAAGQITVRTAFLKREIKLKPFLLRDRSGIIFEPDKFLLGNSISKIGIIIDNR